MAALGVFDRTFYRARVSHARLRPKKNQFVYGVDYLALPLRAQSSWPRRLFLGIERFSLFSFYARDHATREKSVDLLGWIDSALRQYGLDQANGEVVLVTMPRVMGYVFNPVSFWFCLDRQGGLRAVLCEVNNTFGDRHCYICFHDDQRVIGANDLLYSDKVFHVSPFMKIEGRYTFRFAYGEDQMGIWIDYETDEGLMLKTAVTGKRQPLTSRALLMSALRYPLMTLRVIYLIHYQALKLWLKGVKYIPRPQPPQEEITR